MKLKHLVIFGVLLVLLGIAVVLKKQQKPAELTTEEYISLNLSFDSAKVSQISIGKGKDLKAVELAKNEAGAWILPTFFKARADEKKIQDLFKAIAEAKGELRAKDKALLADFGLADDTAYHIRMLDASKKPVFELLLGPKRPQQASVFVRKGGSDQVFYTETDLFGQIGIYEDAEKASPQSDYWGERRLLTAQIDQIDAFTTKRFASGQETVTTQVLRETDPNDPAKKKWRFVRDGLPFAIDAGKIKQYLESYPSRPASKILDPKAKDYGFAAPKWQMKLHQDNGQEILVTAGAEDPETQGVYMQVSTEPVVFLLPKYYFTNGDIDDSKFFMDDPLAVNPDRTSELVIHADTTELQFKPQEKKQDSVTQYMDKMKSFRVERLLFDPAEAKKVRAGGSYWLKLHREGGVPVIIDVGEPLTADKKEYAVQKRGDAQAFAISATAFKNFFQNLESLTPPASA